MKLVFIHHSLNYDTMIQIEGISHRHHELKYLPNISKEVLREKRLHILQSLYNRIILGKFNCVVTDFSAGSKAIKEYKEFAKDFNCGLLIYSNECVEDEAYDTYVHLRGDIRGMIDHQYLKEEKMYDDFDLHTRQLMINLECNKCTK